MIRRGETHSITDSKQLSGIRISIGNSSRAETNKQPKWRGGGARGGVDSRKSPGMSNGAPRPKRIEKEKKTRRLSNLSSFFFMSPLRLYFCNTYLGCLKGTEKERSVEHPTPCSLL